MLTLFLACLEIVQGMMSLEGGISARSRDQEIDARAMDLFLTAAQGGPQQLSRAVATGQVVVRQGQRRGTSERAEYTAAEGKFVLSGGQPTLYDAFRGTRSEERRVGKECRS